MRTPVDLAKNGFLATLRLESADLRFRLVEAKERIEQLERELENTQSSLIRTNGGFEFYRDAVAKAATEIAAEKALADRFGRAMQVSNSELQAAFLAWRKARGL